MPITPEIKGKLQEFLQQVAQDAPVFAAKMQARLAVLNAQRAVEGKPQLSMVDWVTKILIGVATQQEISARAQQLEEEEKAEAQRRLVERLEAAMQAAEDTL